MALPARRCVITSINVMAAVDGMGVGDDDSRRFANSNRIAPHLGNINVDQVEPDEGAAVIAGPCGAVLLAITSPFALTISTLNGITSCARPWKFATTPWTPRTRPQGFGTPHRTSGRERRKTLQEPVHQLGLGPGGRKIGQAANLPEARRRCLPPDVVLVSRMENLSSVATLLLQDPITAVTRERQKLLWVVSASSLLVQLGALQPDVSTGVPFLGLLIKREWLEHLAVASVFVVLGTLSLFVLSGIRDYKAARFGAVAAWQAVNEHAIQLQEEAFNEVKALARSVLAEEECTELDVTDATAAQLRTAVHELAHTDSTTAHELIRLTRRVLEFRIQVRATNMHRTIQELRSLQSGLQPETPDPIFGELDERLQALGTGANNREERVSILRERNRLALEQAKARVAKRLQEDAEFETSQRAVHEKIAQRNALIEQMQKTLFRLEQRYKAEMPLLNLVESVRRLDVATVCLEIALPLGFALLPIFVILLSSV
jgi:hypothetical protein